jgi:hypothetical protein
MQFGLDLAKSDLVIEFGVTKVIHLRMKRFDFARRDAVSSDIVQHGDGPIVRGLELRDALDHRRHLMAEQSEVGGEGRYGLEGFQACFDPAQACFDASDVGFYGADAYFDAAEAAVDRTKHVKSFGVGHPPTLTHIVFAYDRCTIGPSRSRDCGGQS